MPTPRQLVHHLITERLAEFPNIYPPAEDTFDTLPTRDRAFAQALYKEVIRRWLTVRALLNKGLKKPIRRMEDPLAAIMMTAAVEMLFFDGTPDYAVIHQAVEDTRVIRPAAAGLVNAGLRRLQESVVEREETFWDAQPDTLPTEKGLIRFKEGMIPPPGQGDSWLSVVSSTPIELVSRWRGQFEPWGHDIAQLLASGLYQPPLLVFHDGALNALNDARFKSCQWRAHETDPRFAIWQSSTALLFELMHERPMDFWVQDVTAMKVVDAMAAHVGDASIQVLDLCAGRGTKTRGMIRGMPNAQVTATDTDQDRFEDLSVLTGFTDRLTVKRHEELLSAGDRYDVVFVDAPCGNSGTLSRRLEAIYRLNKQMIKRMTETQMSILHDAKQLLKPDGLLVYSTCSLEHDENDELAARFADENGLMIERSHQAWPVWHASSNLAYYEHADGGFYAFMR